MPSLDEITNNLRFLLRIPPNAKKRRAHIMLVQNFHQPQSVRIIRPIVVG
jgi:hypothetical protein